MPFLAAGGQTPPPLAECPAKNASFFYVLPKTIKFIYWNFNIDQINSKLVFARGVLDGEGALFIFRRCRLDQYPPMILNPSLISENIHRDKQLFELVKVLVFKLFNRRF